MSKSMDIIVFYLKWICFRFSEVILYYFITFNSRN